MTPNSNLKNQLATRAQSGAPKQGGETVFDLIKRMEGEIKRALPRQISPERFARVAMTAVRAKPELQTCTHASFLAALMQSAQLGLEPNTPLGQAYLIPYAGEVQFQLGYQGLLTLAYRTGEYQSIYAHPVYKNDKFEYEYGLEQKLVHIPADDPEGEPIRYYAVYRLANGGFDFRVKSRQQIVKHRDKFSPSVKKGKPSPWQTDFDSMAMKTVLKELLRYAPRSAEFSAALAADESVKTEIAEDMLDVPNTIDTTAEQVENTPETETTSGTPNLNPAITAEDSAYIDSLLAEEGKR